VIHSFSTLFSVVVVVVVVPIAPHSHWLGLVRVCFTMASSHHHQQPTLASYSAPTLHHHQSPAQSLAKSDLSGNSHHAIDENTEDFTITASELYNTWSIGGLQEHDVEELQRTIDDESIRAIQCESHASKLYGRGAQCWAVASIDPDCVQVRA
jgi:hypothetical protein